MKRGNDSLRKTLSLLLLLCLITAAAACGAEEGPDYRGIGLKVTGVMDELFRSREFKELFFNDEERLKLVDSMFNTGDYDRPAAVYRLKPGDPREWIMKQLTAEEQEKLETMSPAVQEQVWTRYRGLSYVCSMISGRKSAQILATVSIFQVQLTVPELETEEAEYRLFVFEKGIPILVTYGRHMAYGMVLPLDQEETASETSLKSVLAPYGIDVSRDEN